MRQAVQTPTAKRTQTLAAWLELLRPGSPCFCCGAPLRTSQTNKATGAGHTPELICPRCGAGVGAEEEAAPSMSRLQTVLVAA